jgi:hypothetical protein
VGMLCEIMNWNSSTSTYAVTVFLLVIAGAALIACDGGLGARLHLLLRLLNDDSCSSQASRTAWKQRSPKFGPRA